MPVPFLDGNGRVGRLLIPFLLHQRGILSRPLLYLIHFLKQIRTEYYDRSQAVRTRGAWTDWLAFFLRGVRDVATEAHAAARTNEDVARELGWASERVDAVWKRLEEKGR